MIISVPVTRTDRPQLPSGWMRLVSNCPKWIATLWLINAAVGLLHGVLSTDAFGQSPVGALYQSTVPILVGFFAASLLRLRSRTLNLVALLLGTSAIIEAIWLSLGLLTELIGREPSIWPYMMGATWLVTGVVTSQVGIDSCGKVRRSLSAVLAVALHVMLIFFPSVASETYWQLSARAQSWTGQEENSDRADGLASAIEPDRLWEAQPNLIKKATNGLSDPTRGAMNVYGVSVAASGVEDIFSREAKAALASLAGHFGSNWRGGVLLSNGADDLLHAPLATNGNLAQVLAKIGEKIDPTRDLLVVYLASHGDQDASLESDLPYSQSFTPITTISADTVSSALVGAGIERRIIVVSACYSGTWIRTLSSDDTIVLTAAAKDRTSFGCSDERTLTYFGEALLEGPLSSGVSLSKAFEHAKKKVDEWESGENYTPSLPQSSVGRNMESLWIENRSRS